MIVKNYNIKNKKLFNKEITIGFIILSKIFIKKINKYNNIFYHYFRIKEYKKKFIYNFIYLLNAIYNKKIKKWKIVFFEILLKNLLNKMINNQFKIYNFFEKLKSKLNEKKIIFINKFKVNNQKYFLVNIIKNNKRKYKKVKILENLKKNNMIITKIEFLLYNKIYIIKNNFLSKIKNYYLNEINNNECINKLESKLKILNNEKDFLENNLNSQVIDEESKLNFFLLSCSFKNSEVFVKDSKLGYIEDLEAKNLEIEKEISKFKNDIN